MRNMVSPCKNCKDRKLYCHAIFEKYKMYAIEHKYQKESNKRQKQAIIEREILRHNRIEKEKRRHAR